jgi:hypothetical protein
MLVQRPGLSGAGLVRKALRPRSSAPRYPALVECQTVAIEPDGGAVGQNREAYGIVCDTKLRDGEGAPHCYALRINCTALQRG